MTLTGAVFPGEPVRRKRQRHLPRAVRAFDGLGDVEAVREQLVELRERRDIARERLAQLQAAEAPTVTVTESNDWDVLTLDEQRAIIRAVIDRVTVSPGRGEDRITIEPRGQ